MSLPRTVSEINGYFSRKSVYLKPPPLKGFPLELGTDAKDQKLE